MNRTPAEWNEILVRLGVKPFTAARWSTVFSDVIQPGTFSAGDDELDDFLGQILHESAMLERTEEALSYSTTRLCSVWPKRFPSIADAGPYAHNPEALANKVYGGRLGNTEPGDGYKYRGRGLVQITGRANYAAVAEALRLDLIGLPELLSEPAIALRASIAWWEGNIPDSVLGDIVKVSKRVNGGTVGLAERERLTDEARNELA